ncbi:MAG: STAS domain-containing protein [Actinomycetota bacterium]|nr:STAS domain-containing protein [Actinomycetota bacterium]
MSPLQVSVLPVGRHALVNLAGELDVASAPTLRQRFVELASAGQVHVVVDLAQVDFLDDVGLGVLLGGAMRSRARGGTFALVCSRPRLLEILALSGLDRAVAVHATLESALAQPPP